MPDRQAQRTSYNPLKHYRNLSLWLRSGHRSHHSFIINYYLSVLDKVSASHIQDGELGAAVLPVLLLGAGHIVGALVDQLPLAVPLGYDPLLVYPFGYNVAHCRIGTLLAQPVVVFKRAAAVGVGAQLYLP